MHLILQLSKKKGKHEMHKSTTHPISCVMVHFANVELQVQLKDAEKATLCSTLNFGCTNLWRELSLNANTAIVYPLLI